MSAKPILVAALLSLSQSAWPDAVALAVYPAFAAPGAARAHFIEGRVIELSRSSEPAATDGKRTNLRRNLALLVNSELEAHPVRVRVAGVEYNTLSDAEGYFRIQVEDTGALTAGWNRITATSEGATTDGALLLTPAANVHGLISDLDDTILITEVHSKRRMLANTLFGNPLQRRAVSGTAQLYHRLAGRNTDPGAAPIFYLSASPRQLHAAIQSFLDHNQFPRGVLITKRITNDATSEPLTDQAAYKAARIDDIFVRTPHVRYTLIGDDGERDPEIYHDARLRWPDRVEAIWIRRVNPDSKRPRLPDQRDLADLLGEP